MPDILTITVFGAVIGATSYENTYFYEQNNAFWFNDFLDPELGIPSRDSFHRAFDFICAAAIRSVNLNGEPVALAETSIRRSSGTIKEGFPACREGANRRPIFRPWSTYDQRNIE